MAGLIKTVGDRLVAALALLMLSPLILTVAIALRFQMGTPILFTQDRSRKDGKVFQLCKFRTMTDAKNSAGELLSDDKRLTAIGKLLRKTSLDELPQLRHVLKGEMSIVGSRPLLVRYLKLHNAEQARRHNVLPGITGWAQVNGRRNLDSRWQLY